MAITPIDYFFDGQLRRFLLQIVRAFSGFQYEIGARTVGGVIQPAQQLMVPCKMASSNRQVAQIINNNSENAIQTCPQIAVYITGIAQNRQRTQAPGHVSTVQVLEREVDPLTGRYTGNRGNAYTVARVMPHPLDLTVQVDVWTSNMMQKHQLFEQIYSNFNAGFDIQNSENPLDWTSITTMTLDSMTWSSQSIPVGTNDEIDIMSFVFVLPVWITPAAKVKAQKIIQQVVTNIVHGTALQESFDTVDGPQDSVDMSGFDSGDTMAQSIVTPDDARISIDNGVITLLDHNETPLEWAPLLSKYGKLNPTVSTLFLKASIEEESNYDIVGTIQATQDPTKLQWTVDIDTLPSNTLAPILAIIDPRKNYPGQSLLPPSIGQRYLILSDLGPSVAWGQGTTAKAGDILEYTSGGWVSTFVASTNHNTQFVVNLKTGKQLKFFDGQWILAIDGQYNPGYWRLRL